MLLASVLALANCSGGPKAGPHDRASPSQERASSISVGDLPPLPCRPRLITLKLPGGNGLLPPEPVAVSLCVYAPDGTTSADEPLTTGARRVAEAINAAPEFVQGKTPCRQVDDTNVYIWTFVYQDAASFHLEHSFGFPSDCDNVIVNETARLGASDALKAYRAFH